MIQFRIEQHRAVPAARQIEEQIKLAVSIGTVRSGDILPSIREVAKQTGINRGKVHHAYLALEHLGLIVLRQGEGARVASTISSQDRTELRDKCQRLSRKLIADAHRLGVSPTSLARYLAREAYQLERAAPFIAFVGHKPFAVDTAGEISKLWGVHVSALTYDDLKNAIRGRFTLRKVLVHQLRVDLVRSIIGNKKIDVIPVRMRLSDETVHAYKGFKPDASVVLLVHKREFPSQRFIVEQTRQWMKSSDVSAVLWKGIPHIKNLLNGSRYDHVVVDHSMWSELPPALRAHRKILLARTQLDLPSVEAARIRAGVII